MLLALAASSVHSARLFDTKKRPLKRELGKRKKGKGGHVVRGSAAARHTCCCSAASVGATLLPSGARSPPALESGSAAATSVPPHAANRRTPSSHRAALSVVSRAMLQEVKEVDASHFGHAAFDPTYSGDDDVGADDLGFKQAEMHHATPEVVKARLKEVGSKLSPLGRVGRCVDGGGWAGRGGVLKVEVGGDYVMV